MYGALVKSLSDAQSIKEPAFLRVSGVKCPFERTKPENANLTNKRPAINQLNISAASNAITFQYSCCWKAECKFPFAVKSSHCLWVSRAYVCSLKG